MKKGGGDNNIKWKLNKKIRKWRENINSRSKIILFGNHDLLLKEKRENYNIHLVN